MSLERVKSILDPLDVIPGLKYSINATGEEPTYYEDLIAWLEFLNSKPHFEKETGLSSNGWGFARDEMLAERLRDLGICSVRFTLYGMKETHDWFAMRRGAFNDMMLAADRCKHAGICVDWNMMLHRRNIDEIPIMLHLFEKRSEAWNPVLAEPDGRGWTNREHMIDHTDLAKLPSVILKEMEENFTDLTTLEDCSTCVNRKYPPIYIEHDGDAYYQWNNFIQYSSLNGLGNVFRDDINEMLHRTRDTDLFKTLRDVSLTTLARRYGTESDRIYNRCILHQRWMEQYLAERSRISAAMGR